MPEDEDDIRRYQSYFQREYDKDVNDGPLLLNYWVLKFRILIFCMSQFLIFDISLVNLKKNILLFSETVACAFVPYSS